MKLVWVSDIHLNFVKDATPFYEDIKSRSPDVVVISGDIAESNGVVSYIERMELHLGVPVYFVLGNHDFYGSSVAEVKRSVKHIGHLGSKQIVPLSSSTALVGVDGWGDCRNGDYESSRLIMSDWLYIKELNTEYLKGSDELKRVLQRLADSDAKKLQRRVRRAIDSGFKRIIIVSHVPPFEDACLNAGRKSTPGGLCFFSSKILGTTIKPIAKQNPNIDFLWLCGHTHSKIDLHVLPNLLVRVAQSEYYYPTVADVISYD